MPTDICHFIDGVCFPGASGRMTPSYNPATGEQSGLVSLASAAEAGAAVAAAKRAFPSWASTPPLRRARILNRFLRLCEERTDALAAIITAEHGKVLSDAKGEVQRGLEVVEFAIGIPQLLKGEVTRKRRHACRFPRAAPASGSDGRHHAIQFSRHGADVDDPCRAGLRQRLHPEALASATLPPHYPCRMICGARRDSRTACSMLCRATKKRWMRSWIIRTLRAVSFVGSTPIAQYVYLRAARKKCAGAWRRQEPFGRHA